MFGKLLGLVTCVTLFLTAGAVNAASKPVTFQGNVELRAPIWSTFDASAKSHWNNLEMAGDVRIFNLFGPVVFRAQGEHTFHQAGIFAPENKLKLGFELPIPKSDFTLFSYYDQRFNADTDRVFVGIRYGFGGTF